MSFYYRRLQAGLRLRGWHWIGARLFSCALAGGGFYGVLLSAELRPSGHWAELALWLSSGTLVGLLSVAQPKQISFLLSDGRTRVRIRPGDLLNEAGHVAVGVNEYFDCELGDRVARASLHGQLVMEIFGGNSDQFREAVDRALVPLRDQGSAVPGADRRRYPIGTVAVLPLGARKIFLPALAHTDLEDNWKAWVDVDELVLGLTRFWKVVRSRAGGERVAVPLFGHGQSNVRLPPQALLQLLLITLERASRDGGICDVDVVLREDVYLRVDPSPARV